MRVLFMGTPDFAVPALNAIAKEHEVVGVITQQDKPRGRGHKMSPTPVKEAAIENNIEVYQPIKVKEQESVKIIRELNPDVIVVIAFGQILSKEILDIPRLGCINVHASLLPKYRGAAPIQWAVINGDEYSGVDTMYMEEGLDTGDIIESVKVKLDKDETGGSLFDRLSLKGAEVILSTLKKLESGEFSRTKQDESQATYAGKITKDMGLLDYNKSASELECLIRGLNPWPAAFTFLDSKRVKVWKASVVDIDKNVTPGTIVSKKKQLVIATADKGLSIDELQVEGKKRMKASDFLNGVKIVNDIVG